MFPRTTVICLIIAGTALTGCNRKDKPEAVRETSEKRIEITGIVEGGSGTEIVLEEMAAREFIPVDTVTCDETGTFRMSFESDQAAFYVLRTGTSGYITLLAEPGESITFSQADSRSDQYKVEGSDGSELLKILSGKHKRTLDALGQITRKNMELRFSPGYAGLKAELDKKFDSITGAFHNYSLDFIHRNDESLAILVALYNLYGQGLPVFHPEEDMEVYRFVDSILILRYPDYEMVELLHAQVTGAEESQKTGQLDRGLDLGEIAPDFVSSRPDGGQMALSDLHGNYVLLHFWAAWSKPGREENRYLVQVWSKFSASPFRILQVSFDGNRQEWLAAIEEDGLEWDHVSDLMRWETIVADLYQVEKIPSNYLIGPEGRILGRDLFGEELIEQLEALFNNE